MARAAAKPKTKSPKIANRNPPPNAPADIADAGSMDKIRDILFGNQVKDFEKRFSHMEERLAKETAELRTEAFKRIDALEVYLKKEIDALNERIKLESHERKHADKQLGKDLNTESTRLTKKIETVADGLTTQTTDLRRQLLDQAKSLAADIQAKYDQGHRELNQACDELEEAKVDRSTLAEFLVDMAMRLSGQSNAEQIASANK